MLWETVLIVRVVCVYNIYTNTHAYTYNFLLNVNTLFKTWCNPTGEKWQLICKQCSVCFILYQTWIKLFSLHEGLWGLHWVIVRLLAGEGQIRLVWLQVETWSAKLGVWEATGASLGVPVGYAVGCKWAESAHRLGERREGTNRGHGCCSKSDKGCWGLGGLWGCHPPATLPLPAPLHPLPGVLPPHFPSPTAQSPACREPGCFNPSRTIPPCVAGAPSAGGGGGRPIGNGGLLILLPVE